MKRLTRWIIANLIVLVLIANIFGIGIASATTGYINITDQQIKTYTTAHSFASGSYAWNTFYFDVANYNYINEIIVTSGADALTFDDDYDSTTFTCSVNCVGSGNVWYDKTNNRIYWLFYDVEVTASPVTIAYATNIFTKVHVAANGYQSANDVGVNKPAEFKASFAGFPDGAITLSYLLTDVSLLNTDTYNYTKTSDYWTLSIEKGGVISTKYFIMDYYDTIFTNEASFNTNDFNFTNATFNGVKTNTTTASGAYTITIIDSEGFAPTPTATVTPDPTTGGGIMFDKETYVLGELSTITYTFDSSAWYDFAVSKKVGVYDFDGNLLYQDDAAQSGYITYRFNKLGGHYARLQKYFLGILVSTYSEDTSVVISLNNLFSTKTQYDYGETAYVYGNFSKSTYPAEQDNGIIRYGQAEGVDSPSVNEIIVSSGLFNLSFTDLPIGRQYVTLYGYLDTNDCKGTTGISICYREKAHIEYDIVPVSAVLGIDWSVSQANVGTEVAYNFSNVTAHDTITLKNPLSALIATYDVYDIIINKGYSSSYYIPHGANNAGTWTLRITNASNSSDYVESNLTTVFDYGGNITNNYSARIYFNTDKQLVNTKTKLTWELGTIPASTPNTATVIIENTNTGSVMKFFTVESDGYENEYFIYPAIYQAQLIYNGSKIAVSNIEITSVSAGTTPISGSPQSGQKGINNLLGFLGITAFWGLLMWIAAVHLSGYNPFIAAIAFIVELVLGLFDPYTMILWACLVLFAVLLGVSKVFGDGKKTERS